MKTKFFYSLAFFFASFSLSINAQSYDYPKFHMGIRGGVTFNNVTGPDKDFYSGKTMAYGGFSFDFRLTQNPLYLETGLYYMNRAFNAEDDFHQVRNGANPSLINIPLLFSYHFYLNDNMSIQPIAGGFVGYLNDFNDEYDDYGKGIEYGIRVGCGVNYGRFYANVGYDFGLVNHNDFGSQFNLNALFVTLGFNIVGSR